MYGYLEMVRQNYDSTHKIKHIEHDRELYVDTCEILTYATILAKGSSPQNNEGVHSRLTQSSAMWP